MSMFSHVIAYVSATLHTHSAQREERGASMTEYALLVAAVAAMVAIVSVLFSNKISTFVAGINL